MVICRNCGVELEQGMLNCPLCGEAINGNGKDTAANRDLASGGKPAFQGRTTTMSRPQKKFTWEIVSLILLSGMIAAFVVDFIINRRITWSEYPAAVSLAIFAYISMLAFWHRTVYLQLAGGFGLSFLFHIGLDLLTGGITWSVRLGMPLLLAASLLTAALIGIIRRSKYKGINLIGWGFLIAALLCLCIEGILTFFREGSLRLEWSVIVAGCVVPMALVLFFVNVRLKKGRSLEKTFHV